MQCAACANRKLKANARAATHAAIRSGRLVRQRCADCVALGVQNDWPVQAHHEDYSKPLEIVWLCNNHHQHRHAKGAVHSHGTRGNDMAITNISYFVICIDYGRKGREAIVDPEMTFRGAVEKVREIIGDGLEIAFAHEVTFMNGSHHVSDVKDELINRANDARLEAAE